MTRRSALFAAANLAPGGDAETIVRRLERAYGKRPWKVWGRPLEELVGTILSQNTSDRNSGAAMERLEAAFADWDAVADAPASKIAAAIRPAGLHRQKARHIRAVLRAVRASPSATVTRRAVAGGRSRAEHGGISLDFLRRWPTARVKQYLLSLPGVGPKTAACVLLFSLRRPVLPVDTHVHRISGRLGLIGPRVTAEQAHEVLADRVPERLVYAFHVLLIEHGRRTCRARRPRCEDCSLADLCPSVGGSA